MRPIDCIIEEVRSEAPLIRTFRLDKNLDPAPGQYVMVWIRGVDEIPMSFSGPATITVQSVGEATQALFRLGAGSSIGLRGPLGNGFILRGKRILLIGGGVGTAPLAFLGEQAKGAGIKVASLLGFRCKDDLIFQERFEALGDTIITTDDGSAGTCGLVTVVLDDLIGAVRPDVVCTCGPEPMQQAVARIAADAGIPCQVSLERRMACGVGACLSCVVPTRDGLKRACVDGPVFDAADVLWDDAEKGETP